MKRLFSKRNAPPPAELRDDLPDQVRRRILATFRDHCGGRFAPPGDFDKLLREVGGRLIKEYGGLRKSSYSAARRSDDPVIEHFACCPTEEALDFIEACLQSPVYGSRQWGVDEVNAILREHGIGFELTPYICHFFDRDGNPMPKPRAGCTIEEQYPQIIRRDEHLIHEEVVRPALTLLTNAKLRVANAEMLKAHGALRIGEFEDAITLCGSAFESVLKTICDLKGWPYNPDRDACAKLVGICRDNGLFPAFYVPILETVGTVRNKLGDAHGRGPNPQHTVTKEQAEHMMHMSSAHILLVAKLAGLE